ncbi:ABC transporter substrate-binding protein [Okeania sp.]|uniref:ABC transporter substrate-binding protein n=1 Tax=Okeania sp. TaxID=3100323 RepID=UPI002B4ACFBC|nr:ABC transporter substrate-binding protein [Okeania sp.]MEB3341209.1 ABC transporter substrate-binding protein [Okeania sp.]
MLESKNQNQNIHRFTIFRVRLFLVGILLFCLLIMTSSCRSTLLNSQSNDNSKLVLVNPTPPSTFNYPISRSPYGIFGYIYEGLMSENGLTGELEPALAESWIFSEDQKRIIFTLRSELKWSNGEPLTADDVVFTYQDIYLNQKIPTVYRDFLRIGSSGAFPSIKKIDQRRIEFILPEPFAPFLRYILRLKILPAHALRDSVSATDADGKPLFLSIWNTNTQPEKIISNGAFKLENYIPSQRIVLQKNPFYWRSDSAGESLPYLDKIIIQIIPSTDNQLLRFRSGELDSIRVDAEAFQLLKREEKRGKYKIYNGGPQGGYQFVGFNLNQGINSQGKPFLDPIKSSWFNNLAFRQAVAYGINRQRINNNIYRGLGEIQHSALGVNSPYYLSPKSGLKVYQYNPKKAKKILLDAGFKYNNVNELLDENGNQVEFTILVKSEEKLRIDTAVQIKEDLSQIGIKGNLQILNFNTVLQKLLLTRDWECYVGAFGVPGSDFEPNLLSLLWSSQGSFHQFNLGSRPGEPPIKNWQVSDWEKEIDRLFTAGYQTVDENKRREIYGEFQKIVAEQLPIFFLVNPLSLQAIRNHIDNLKFSAIGGAFWNIDELKIRE